MYILVCCQQQPATARFQGLKLKKTCQQRNATTKTVPEFCVVLTYFPNLEYVHKLVNCNFKVAKYISVLPNNYCLILSTELPNSLQPTLPVQ